MTTDADLALTGAIAVLRDAYPRQDFPEASVLLYTEMLSELDGFAVAAAIRRLVKRSPFLPSIAEINLEVAEAMLGLPNAAQAWSLVSQPHEPGQPELPRIVSESMKACGGRWSIIHSENPSVLRSQFTADYNARRQTELLRIADAAPADVVAIGERGAYAELPPAGEETNAD